MSNPQRFHELQPSRLFCPWDFPGKSTGVGCHLAEKFPNLQKPQEAIKKMKRHPSKWEKTAANNISDKVIYKIFEELIQLNLKNKLKSGQRNWTFSKKRHLNSQQVCKKLLNITNQGNTNINYLKLLVIANRKARDKKLGYLCTLLVGL